MEGGADVHIWGRYPNNSDQPQDATAASSNSGTEGKLNGACISPRPKNLHGIDKPGSPLYNM